MASIKNKKKLKREDFQFVSKTGETLTKKPGDINGIDFKIKDLHDCVVYLMDHTAQIQIDKCTNTKFFIGPIKGSIFVRDCKDCEISVACSQFRTRDLYNSKVYLFVDNEPCIESSNKLEFGPYNFCYPGIKEHAKTTGLKTEINKWDLIFDFTKQESGELNYSIIPPADWKLKNTTIDGVDGPAECAFSYPVRYGGTIPDDAYFGEQDKGMKTFDITKTSQKDVEKEMMKKKIEKHLIKKEDDKPKPPPEINPNSGDQQVSKVLMMGIAAVIVYVVANQVMNK